MHYKLNVLVAGRSNEALTPIEAMLRGNDGVRVGLRHIVNGHADPLYDQPVMPDALVLAVSGGWEAELAALAERPASERPPLLVVGPSDNPELIRTAMRAGARDFLDTPVAERDVLRFVEEVRRERDAATARRQPLLTAVINAKGGSGASMIAANVARIFAGTPQRRTVLVDMDVQFGALPLYFNLAPVNGLVRALELVDTLDTVALEGYVLSHESGLDLIASAPEELVLPSEIPEGRVEQFLRVLGEAYDDIVVDLPRWIGESNAAVLERADRILVVMQQSVAHLRDAKRMVRILQQDMGVAAGRIVVVVNRFDKRSAVSLRDVREALPSLQVITLPNDFRRVSESINLGSPLHDLARRATVTRDLERLSSSVSADVKRTTTPEGFWSRLPWART